MAKLNDYLIWRGDLSFSGSSFNEVDGAILSILSYFDYDIVIDEEELPFPLNYGRVISDYLSIDDCGEIKLGLIFPTEKYLNLLRLVGTTPRFADIEISDYVNEQNIKNCYQFSACTFHLTDGSLAIVFRGTDDTLVGWREDFCMSFMDEIPAQRLAVNYLKFIAEKYPAKPIYICGHSKGGNLSVYSAGSVDEAIQGRIVKVFSYDGPGINEKTAELDGYKAIKDKLFPLVPQASMIGIMFNNGEYSIVKSGGVGFYQHDPSIWEVQGNKFIKLSALSRKGEKNREVFLNAMQKMTTEEKQNFVNIFFSAIEKTGAHTLMDINDTKLKSLSVIFKSMNDLEKRERELMLDIIKRLFEK